MITENERIYVFDRLKGFIVGNYVEKQVEQAKTRSDAVKAAKQTLGICGFAGPGQPSVWCNGSGIRVTTKDGREAKYSWGDFADYILNTQMRLF